MEIIDPQKFVKKIWPHITLYNKQIDVMYSVRDNDETIVPAGNQLGKDFIVALTCLWFFCSRRPSRVVTTSVKYDQLNAVLWGEIRRLLSTAKYNLPIQYNHMHIRQVDNAGVFIPRCELVGQCVSQSEGLLGRHLERPNGIPTTLVAFDEASGMDTSVYESSDTWAHRKLIIGNPFPCTNFFFNGVRDGDLKKEDGKSFYRKIIKITADDSPNVRYAKAQIKKGIEPTSEILIPGVLDYDTYKKRKLLWDDVRQCVSLNGEFYMGAEVKLFPPAWISASHAAAEISSLGRTSRRAIGVDPAEGGDDTSWSVIDEKGLLYLHAEKTPDTSIIPGRTIALMREWNVPAERVMFDRGGGGKEHADIMRKQGYDVKTVAFGGPVKAEKSFGLKSIQMQEEEDEERYAYKNRRAQMFHALRQRINPTIGDYIFGIPRKYKKLIEQMEPIPLTYDDEGRIMLLPKNKKSKDSKEKTLVELIGYSPNELDALCVAIHAMDSTLIELTLGMSI